MAIRSVCIDQQRATVLGAASLKLTMIQSQQIHPLSAQPSLAFLFRVDFVCSRSESRQRAHFTVCWVLHECPVSQESQKLLIPASVFNWIFAALIEVA
jgi:hypothetical protein